jgi:predicted PurR-regulated permease PerM
MPSRFVLFTFLAFLLVTTLVVAKIFSVFFTAVVLALILVSLFQPLHKKLIELLPGRRRGAALASTVVVFVGVVVPVVLLFAALTKQAFELYQTTRNTDTFSEISLFFKGESQLAIQVKSLAERIGIDLSADNIQQIVSSTGQTAGSFLYENVTGAAQNAVGFLFHFGIMVIIIFALFLDGQKLKDFLMKLSPLPDEEEEIVINRFREISQAVFLGNGMASSLQGILGGIAFSVAGLGPAVLWGSVITIFAFLPIVGAAVIFVPATAYLILRGDYQTAILYFGFNASYVAVLEYGLKPKLIGGRAELPGILVFLGIVGGLSAFGILGLFFGPLALTMFLTAVKLYHERYKPSLMTQTEMSPPAQAPTETSAPDNPGIS